MEFLSMTKHCNFFGNKSARGGGYKRVNWEITQFKNDVQSGWPNMRTAICWGQRKILKYIRCTILEDNPVLSLVEVMKSLGHIRIEDNSTTRKCTQVRSTASICTKVRQNVFTCAELRASVHPYIHTHTRTHARTHTRTHTHKETQAQRHQDSQSQ